ncbi:unnamed protein product [Polarella glacialis]|uniref:Uncharacterized protein n=1 Tax=Polarella glacialis TaxID=89957 RepID=A0A813K3Z8_POLGL|nr:unnamed protein product [Polarella glacialis]CAE8691930.1 unnamed protein product [Polarella glacialis]
MCVTRSGKNHYDVLHGAMFAEGRGSHLTMIQYLLGAKAEMSKNLDGRFPLHIAYTTGNIPVIRLLRTYLVEAGVREADYKNDKVPLPLELCIRGGNMTQVQLSQEAELSTLSLSTFIHRSPRCVPSFLDRLEHSVLDVARNLTSVDVAQMLRKCPTWVTCVHSWNARQPNQCVRTTNGISCRHRSASPGGAGSTRSGRFSTSRTPAPALSSTRMRMCGSSTVESIAPRSGTTL